MKLIGTARVVRSGRHIGFFDVFEVDTGTYFAHPRNNWTTDYTPKEWDEFYFGKIGSTWKTEPPYYDGIALDIIEELEIK